MTDELIVASVSGAGGLISNIFEHKIEKLKQRLIDNDLTNEISPDRLAPIINNYLTKLSHRVSEITSIAFPQHKLPLASTYEPLKLTEIPKDELFVAADDDDDEFFFDTPSSDEEFDLIHHVKVNDGSYIIIDNAGMGKTTFSKFIIS